MAKITAHKALQQCGQLGFCYLCGKAFAPGDKPNRDHVPPKAMFLPEDRRDPLILPTHPKCNQKESVDDELVGQLVSVLHGKRPRPERLRLDVIGGYVQPGGQPIAMTPINLARITWRWVRAFHAALYGEYLPCENGVRADPPVPRGRLEGDQFIPEPILPFHAIISKKIKKNRHAKNLDLLKCCNGKCCYECVFVPDDKGRTLCLWALRIYNWEKLADRTGVATHGCMGCYAPPAGIPQGASRGTRLEFPFSNKDPLDPFEQ